MTPPRFRILDSTGSQLSCETCRTIPSPLAGEGSMPSVDSFTLSSSPDDRFQLPRFQPPSLFSLAFAELPFSAVAARRLPGSLLVQIPVPAAASTAPSLGFADFLPALVELANHIERMDLDFYRIPVNRGSGLCRFSEYTPRAIRPDRCNLTIHPGTTARGHGEIRPIRGGTESLITRVLVDFRPNVVNLLPGLPSLEIDGFAAVDPPRIRFNRDFPSREGSVLGMSGGDYDYENPMSTGENFTTPFESGAEPPPGDHRYWMFRFLPIADTAVAGLQQAFSDGDFSPVLNQGLGALLLWAFLPTAGLYEAQPYEELGLPFNTFPRRLGDLLRLLSPLFSQESREALRQSAPLINPNTEYIDGAGVRRTIPLDPEEVQQINRERRVQGLPLIGRNRGGILDWISSELVQDPERLGALDEDQLPFITVHARLEDVTLNLPMGRLEIRAGTELRAHFAIERFRDSETGQWRARRSLRITLEPASLGPLQFQMQDAPIEASSLSARRVVLMIPSLDHLGDAQDPQLPRWSVILEDAQARGLRWGDEASPFRLEAEHGRIGRVRIDRYPHSLRGDIERIRARNLRVHQETGGLAVDRAVIPSLRIRGSYPPGEAQRLTVRMDRLESEGFLNFGWEREAVPTHVNLRARATLEDLNFHQETDALTRRTRLGFDITGSVDSAELRHEHLGAASFTTRGAQPFHGTFTSATDRPRDPQAPVPAAQFSLDLDLPFIEFWTQGSLVEIAEGSSTLERGTLRLSPGQIALEGELDLHAALPRGLGEGPTDIGNFIIQPRIEDLRVQGPARFEFFTGGWRLSRPEAAAGRPLGITFRIADSRIEHRPRPLPPYLARLPQAAIIQTDLALLNAEVRVEDLREVEYRQIGTEAEPRGGFTRLESGAIAAHHLLGSGNIWINLAIWGFVRGFFPHLGTGSGTVRASRPSSAPLTRHLDAPTRDLLGDGDFFRLGGVRFRRYSNGWESELTDVLLNVHEEGGRSQFGMIRIPEVILAERQTRTPLPPESDWMSPILGESEGHVRIERDWEWYLDPNFLLNIFLDEPERGGSFRFVRWPAQP